MVTEFVANQMMRILVAVRTIVEQTHAATEFAARLRARIPALVHRTAGLFVEMAVAMTGRRLQLARTIAARVRTAHATCRRTSATARRTALTIVGMDAVARARTPAPARRTVEQEHAVMAFAAWLKPRTPALARKTAEPIAVMDAVWVVKIPALARMIAERIVGMDAATVTRQN